MTAVGQFCAWCQDNGLHLAHIRPLDVSAYIETLHLSAPSTKQHLAALRGLFNWLVIKQVVPDNPALFVKGPKFSRKVGITPIMEAPQMRHLLDSIAVVRKVKVSRKHGGGHSNHTFRGTGITVYLQNGGSLEGAQEMANHSDPRTTKLYDRRKDLATLSEIERRIAFE